MLALTGERLAKGRLRLHSVLDCIRARLVKLAAPLSGYVKAKQFRLVVEDLWGKANGLPVLLCKHVGERTTEKCSVQVQSLQWHVHFFALGAEHFYSALPQLIVHAVRQHSLLVAQGALAVAEERFKVPIVEQGHTYKEVRKS